MAQIAAKAGVALSTVSYVLSGKRPVSPAMRDRVQSAIEELNYKPRVSAQALASGTSRTVALFLPSPRWDSIPVQQTFVAGAAQATSARDYALLLSTTATEPDTIVSVITNGRADGAILMETVAYDRRVERLRGANLPFTLIGRVADLNGISFVDVDFGAAVRAAVTHLYDIGHRTIALFNFPIEQQRAGYMSALIAGKEFSSASAELGIHGIQLCCPHAVKEAAASATKLLKQEPQCTAAITTGLQFSGLLRALHDANLRVPDEFSIISIIDSQYAEMITPALTTIEWPAFEAGRLAANLLIGQLEGTLDRPAQLLIGGGLVIRESTGPAPCNTLEEPAQTDPQMSAATQTG